jgi:histone-lysine N-methyltransferase SETMAR
VIRSGVVSSLDKQNEWFDPGQVVKRVAKRDRFSRKAMLRVWWKFEGVIHFVLVKNNRAIDAELCSAQLDQMYVELRWKYSALVHRKRVLPQQDNAPPHTARKTKGKLRELDATELLPRPAYSPDLAPSDFHLFQAMAHFLRGRSFESIEPSTSNSILPNLPERT